MPTIPVANTPELIHRARPDIIPQQLVIHRQQRRKNPRLVATNSMALWPIIADTFAMILTIELASIFFVFWAWSRDVTAGQNPVFVMRSC
jgi:hypothetical protein